MELPHDYGHAHNMWYNNTSDSRSHPCAKRRAEVRRKTEGIVHMVYDEELFQTLLGSLADGVYFVDTQRTIQFWNAGAEQITGFSKAEVTGISCADNILVHVDEKGNPLCTGSCPLSETMADGKPRINRVYLKHKEGHRLPVRATTAAIRDKSGKMIGGLETFHDDTTTVAALQEVEHLTQCSFLCSLTGIGNRRYAEDTLSKRLDETHRNQTLCAVMMLDVDHFKNVNDTYGHPVGDVVLKMVARTLAGALRSYDFVGRWGGEEFIVILPNLRLTDIEQTANRLRVLIEHSSREATKGRISVTVSVGATLSLSADTSASIISRVDRLLYQSKREGRNRATIG